MRILTLYHRCAGAGRRRSRPGPPTRPGSSRQLKALQDRVERAGEEAPGRHRPGMTPEQQQDFNRIEVKAEALEDWRDAAGLKGLKLSG